MQSAFLHLGEIYLGTSNYGRNLTEFTVERGVTYSGLASHPRGEAIYQLKSSWKIVISCCTLGLLGLGKDQPIFTLQLSFSLQGIEGSSRPEVNPYGPPVAPEEAPEAITQAVASLPPEQMFELMKQMKVNHSQWQ